MAAMRPAAMPMSANSASRPAMRAPRRMRSKAIAKDMGPILPPSGRRGKPLASGAGMTPILGVRLRSIRSTRAAGCGAICRGHRRQRLVYCLSRCCMRSEPAARSMAQVPAPPGSPHAASHAPDRHDRRGPGAGVRPRRARQPLPHLAAGRLSAGRRADRARSRRASSPTRASPTSWPRSASSC